LFQEQEINLEVQGDISSQSAEDELHTHSSSPQKQTPQTETRSLSSEVSQTF